MTAQNINNGIAVRNQHQLLSLVSINKEIAPEGFSIFDEGISRFILSTVKLEPFKTTDVDVLFSKGRNLELKASPPKLDEGIVKQIARKFYNYTTKQEDTIKFAYSPQYINYSYDFPLVLSHISCSKLPISPVFLKSFFPALTPKLEGCKNKEDSINFLMRFTQTILKYEHKKIIYSPEASIVNRSGDCSDYSLLLAFLLSYYFDDLEIAFLNYDRIEHVCLGIYDAGIDTRDKSFVEYKGKKYLLAELTGESVLGDIIFKGVRQAPSRITE